MPDFKCADCRIRLRSPGGDAVGERCPVCEAPLEPVGELSELVGFRSLEGRGTPVEGERASTPEPLTRPVSDLTKRRESRIERSRPDAERWLSDGGSFDPEAVAAALDPPSHWPDR
jgi:hypothetical protein